MANYANVPYTPVEGVLTNTYTVAKGDTLYSIASKLGTTVDELKRLNNLTSNTLQIGQILRIPTEEISETEEDIYVVKSGDTLYSIARNNSTTVDTLKTLNNLTSDTLRVGQLLKLPSPLIPDNTYTVQKGDTLYSIANRYNIDVDSLKNANRLTSNSLRVGQILKIPTVNNDTSVNYTVQKGDSLYSIAREYGTTVDEIKNLNNLSSNLLRIGQILKIPTSNKIEATYTVQRGDSLYSIAKKYNTTVDELKRLNNLTSNLLSIGQILIIS